MNDAIKAVLLDFDYTLADSSTGVIDCAKSALAAMGLPSIEPDRIRKAIGLPLTAAFLELVGHDHRTGSPRIAHPSDGGPVEPEEEFALLFIRRADEVMAGLTRVFDSVAPVVSTLTWASGSSPPSFAIGSRRSSPGKDLYRPST